MLYNRLEFLLVMSQLLLRFASCCYHFFIPPPPNKLSKSKKAQHKFRFSEIMSTYDLSEPAGLLHFERPVSSFHQNGAYCNESIGLHS